MKAVMNPRTPKNPLVDFEMLSVKRLLDEKTCASFGQSTGLREPL